MPKIFNARSSDSGSEHDRLNDELATTTSELSQIKGRPVEISDRTLEIERTLAEIQKELSSRELSAASSSPGHVADRTLLEARQSRLLNEQQMLEAEQSSVSVREELLTARQELLARQAAISKETLDALQGVLHDSLTGAARQILFEVEALAQDVPPEDQSALDLAAEVLALAAEFERIVGQHGKLSAAQDRLSVRLAALQEESASIEEQLELSSGGAAMLQVLYELQGRVLSARADVSTPELPSIDEVRLASIQVRQKLDRQSVLEEAFVDSSSQAVQQLLDTRRDVLGRLRTEYGNQIRALAALETSQQRFGDETKRIRGYVAEQLFGFQMRSCPPLSIQSLTDVPEGLIWVFGRNHWQEFGSAILRVTRDRPVVSLGLLLVVLGLLMRRRRIAHDLEQCGARIRRISQDRFVCTVQALASSALLAAPIPIMVGFIAWALRQSSAPSDWMLGVSEGLWRAARIVLLTEAIVAACHPQGLGVAHFGWSPPFVARLRRSIRSFCLVYLPALVLTYSCMFGEAAKYFGSVGRLSFLLANVWSLAVLWRLFQSSDDVLATLTLNQLTRQETRWRRLWFPLLVICPIALCVMACLGYLITAIQLSQGLVWTSARIAGGVILYYLTLRWFSIRHRKLRLAEAVARRRARQEAAEEDGHAATSAEVVPVESDDEQELDLDLVSDQVRTLLRLLFGLGVAAFVLIFWTEVYPLDDVIDSIPIPLGEGLTLLGVVKALLIGVVTYVTVRNLPGILELAILRTISLDSGTRHAINTLARYAVIAIGVVLLLNALRVDWASLSWIAAGLSVGLGFGLQEVVANFVCGLILLFERPIRVGDIVTVDGTTGTVTRINIRATTITNWDRQDFVVPNKNLITGTILNWTLTEPVNRIVIPVGVAYGTDTEIARQILLDVAADHPLILDEPAPMASFEEFADSSLSLLLRAYLPNMDHRIATITELHTEIGKRFAAAGIEIPFPQRDLHVRSRDGFVRGTNDSDTEPDHVQDRGGHAIR